MPRKNGIDTNEQRIQKLLLILQLLVLIVLVGLVIVIATTIVQGINPSPTQAAMVETSTSFATLPATPVIPPLPVEPTVLASASPSASPTITATATSTPIPTPTAFNNPLAAYTVDALTARAYDGGTIQLYDKTDLTDDYEQWLFSYLSDGLRVTGQAHIPLGQGAWPVLILLHGGRSQISYTPGWGTQEMADYFARHGYLTLAPDYQTYNNTGGSSSPLKLPWVIDVMSLIAAVPTLPQADSARIGVLGHSRGGGIATHIMVMSRDIDAVSLYASISADEARNWRMYNALDEVTWPEEDALAVGSPTSNPLGYELISPINFLDRVDVPVQLHHGTWDGTINIEWSRDLSVRLQQAGVPSVELFEYPEQAHTFEGVAFNLFLERNLAFFNQALGVD